jgi:FkbM family methyltransferase
MAKSSSYDDELRQIVERLLSAGGIGIDVGCHRGDILAHMVRVAPSARHIAVEPIPELASSLLVKFPGVRVIRGVLSQHPGTASFRIVRNSLGESSLRQTNTHVKNPDVQIVEVTISRLDDLELDGRPALIKLDTEGAEYSILLGGQQVIAEHRPVIAFEAGGNTTPHFGVTPEMFWEFFEERRYRLTTMRRWLDDKTAPFTRTQFLSSYIDKQGVPAWWQRHKEWMFLAYPS